MADYEDQIAAFRTPDAAPQGDTYEDQIGSFRRQQSEEMGRLRASSSMAVQTSPERVAQQRRLSASTGLPMSVVQTAEGEAKAIAKYNELVKLSQTSPVLRAKLQNPEFTALAQDDGEALSGIEKTMKVIGGTAGRVLGGATVEVGASLMDFSGFVNDMISQAAKATAPAVEGILPINPLGQIAEAAAGGAAKNRQQAKDARASLDYFLPQATNSTEAGLYSGAQSAGFNLATLPAAIEAAILKGPQAAGHVMGMIASLATGSRSYNEARDKGLDPMGSITYAAPAAAAEYLFEKWSGGKFFDDVAARSPFMKMLLNNATREVLGEEATTLTQNFNEWVRLNPEKTVREFIAEQPDAMYQTLVAALVGSGIQTGAMKGIQKLADRQNQSLVNIDEITKLQDMLRIAAGSDLLAKDPQTFKEYVQAVADGTEGAPKSVWVDGRVLNDALAQSGVTPEQLATILPSVQNQLAEAVAANSPVEIPVGELASAAGTDIETALMPHLRTAADGLSLTEAKAEQEQAQQFLQQEAQRIIGQAADQVQANAQTENVRQIIAEQLIATGRYSKDVADKGARLVGDFYTVMAQRLNTTPDKLYGDLLQYKVQAQGQGGLTQADPFGLAVTEDKDETTLYALTVHASENYGNAFVQADANPDGSYSINESGVPLEQRGKGLGVALYEKLIGEAAKRGGVTKSDSSVSADAQRIYAALQRRGYIVTQAADAAVNPETGAMESSGPVFTVSQPSVFDQATNAPGLLNQSFNDQAAPPNKYQDKYLAGRTLDQLTDEELAQYQALGAPGDVLSQEPTRDLIVTHNLTADNLLHAVRMGGIPVPSLAVTKKDTPLTGFGEITLIGDQDLADPKGYAGTKVFGADIYSPRYPSITLDFTANMRKRAEAQLKAGMEATDTRYIEWSEVERDGARELERNAAFLWKFLTDKGLVPEVKRVEATPPAAELMPFVESGKDRFDLMQDEAFIAATWKMRREQLVLLNDGNVEQAEAELAQEQQRVAERGRFYFASDLAGKIDTYRRDVRDNGKIDREGTRYALQEQVRKADLTGEMEAAAKSFLQDLSPNERIFQGYTNSGNRKYIPHTLENVVKILKKELRGGENFNYGVGSLRAKFTPQFKSIDQIRKAKDRLVNKEEFEKVKKEIDDQFWEAARAINGDMSSETAIAIMEDAAKMGVQRAAKSYGYEVSDENAVKVAEFLTRLREMPTEYFEAKILREVDLAEFKGAVVPEGTDPKVIAALQARGVNDIRTYKKGDDADRAAKVAQFENLLFQKNQTARGTYDIASMTTVLNGTADLSTFLHETGHFFLDAIRRMVLSGTATPEVQAMYEQALKGLKVTPEQWEQWHEEYATSGKISDGMRAAHERWAESFELYLFSGQSPNPGTQSLFRTFAEWLKRVYTSMQQFAQSKGITLDADLKAVMDRMLATDAQIEEAETIAGLLPDLDATGEAREKLNARSMRNLQWARNAVNKHIAKLQKEARGLRAEIEEEVRAEVAKQPLYAALRFIKKGEATVDGEEIKASVGHKFNTEAIKEMYPETMLARPDLTKLKGLTNKDGLHPDVIADSFGFPSGDALVRALIEAEPLESVVEGMTDQRMLERHGDLATPEAISAAAIEAVHNDARAKSLATELAAQREMLNPRRDTGQTTANGAKRTVNVLVEAAKAFAQNVIGRRSVKELKKAAWAHLQAERRAGKAWEAATAAGDTQAAVQAKQDQMLNNAAVRAAQQAQADVRAALDLFKKVGKGNNEALVKRGFDPDVVNAARAILTAYGVAGPQSKSALEYLELVQKNDPAMFAAIQPSVVGALTNAKPFDELTVDEVTALRDEIESLWHLAKRSRQMEVDGNLLDREDVQAQLREDMEAKGIPDSMPGDTSAITPKEQALRKLMVFRAAATRVENWAQGMGAKFTAYVFQPIKEAADRYRADKAAHMKRLHELLAPIAGSLKKGEIKAPELNGYTFGKDTSGVGMAEVLHAVIHTGNESNKRKLLLGRGWATENEDGTLDTTKWDAFIDRMVRTGQLTQAHYDFAQGVWDLFEATKPLAQKTHRDVFGRYFAEVTADSFVDPFGVTRRGGYAPAITDTRIVSDAATRSLMETENQSMAYAFPTTSKGFTKGRVEYNKPLLLDLRVLGQHLDKVLLFSYMESPVNDVRRVLGAKAVSYGLNRIDPTAADNIITPWLNRAARQQVEAPVAGDAGLMRIFSAARQRAGLATMFANVANAAQQVTGFSIAAVKVKPTYLMSAAAQMIASPKQMIAAVSDASVYMKERMENDVANAESAIRDILLDPSVYEKSTAWASKHAYFLQSAVDNAMGPVIWTAAFNQATEQGQSEKDAVRFADSVIRTTQGSTLPEDVSRIETGNAFVRLFTQFGGYFNMQANLLGTEFAKVAQELGVKKGAGKMLYITTLGFLAPAWVAEAIMQVFRGGPDDEDKDGEYLDDWLAAIFGWSTIRGATAMIPGVGQTINAGINAWNSKPYDDRMGSAPAISMVESAVRSPASVYNAIVEDGSRQKAVRDVASLISMATGLPANAAARPLGYLAGMSDNRIVPTSGADMARGLVTGNASPQSK